MAGIPATIAQEITDEINQLWQDLAVRGMPLNEIKWRRLFQQTEKLSGTRESGELGLHLQAVLYGLRHDLKGADELFRKSANRYGKTRSWYTSRAAIGPYLAQLSWVIDKIENDYPAGDRNGLATIINSCSQMGLYTTARRALLELESMGVGRKELDLFVNTVETKAAAKYLADIGLDERDVAARVSLSRTVVERHFKILSMRMLAGEFGILYQYQHDAEIDKLIEIDQEILRELRTAFNDTLSDHITIEVAPKE